MKARSLVILEVEKEDRLYRMDLPTNAPLGEAYEVALQFMNEISRLLNEQIDKTNANFEEQKMKAEEIEKETKETDEQT